MDTHKAVSFYEKAHKYVKGKYPDEIEFAHKEAPASFNGMTEQDFLEHYAWVVYAAGFKVSILEKKFPELTKAFNDFVPSKVAATNLEAILKVINNRRKAMCVIDGVKLISKEGFDNFKRRIESQGIDSLKALPGIGEITKDHLARNIGLASVAKNDIWIQRLTKLLGANNHKEMIDYLEEKFKTNKGTIDIILWRFCADNGWKGGGYSTLEEFVGGLG